jgi:hypothetical protein
VGDIEHPEAQKQWDKDRDETEAQRLDRNWSSLLLGVAMAGLAVVIFDAVLGAAEAWVAGGVVLLALAAFWYAMPIVGRHDTDNRY